MTFGAMKNFFKKLWPVKRNLSVFRGMISKPWRRIFRWTRQRYPIRYYECTHEMPFKVRFIFTFRRCRGVDVLEPIDEELLGKTCRATCPPAITATARAYNPNIEVKILKIPPRTQKMKDDGICCQWEFIYKSKKSK